MQAHDSDTTTASATRAIDWKAAVWAGLIAGVVFMMAEMLMVAMFQGESAWGPPRMIAAMVLGQDVLQPPTFDIGIMMTAMMIHIPLSIIYGLALAALLRRANAGTALMIGAAFGLAIYLINFYAIASMIFPWFAMARGWVSAIAHIMFGAVAGLAYVWLRRA
ncbi:hypothetical protein [Lysobacter sp. D1-1-M9]|uniref:hypothetical protein n=1 Tax=Novilysobacter longmucuonensis TaxID=3098603 RepID=UPI002FCA925F